MGSGSGVRHKLGAGNSVETLNEFVFIYLCVFYLPEYLIAGHVARNHNYLVLTCAACRVPGPVDDKFICLIPTSHAIQHQRRPQTFAALRCNV